jgi:hypothetical protein
LVPLVRRTVTKRTRIWSLSEARVMRHRTGKEKEVGGVEGMMARTVARRRREEEDSSQEIGFRK